MSGVAPLVKSCQYPIRTCAGSPPDPPPLPPPPPEDDADVVALTEFDAADCPPSCTR